MKEIDSYDIQVGNLVTNITIIKRKDDFVPFYHISISNISDTTKKILEKIRREFVSQSTISEGDFEEEDIGTIQKRFEKEIKGLLKKYFSNIDERTEAILINYVIRQNLGLGDIEILLKDEMLEEIVINSSDEPVWTYHRKHGWLKTNIILPDETRSRHYATMIGRDVGKDITLLSPLLDAHLKTGDRVNATLSPISTKGNTITIRKFAAKPWTITTFLKDGTMNYDLASMLWLAVENEFSILIAGGTGSGKTSTLNVLANFFPPNQRIISIEDTRELTLPKSLHWVPMETRLPNPEGKGGISMLDLVVNSLRMRPDRIIVGEIRREKEAQVLFEAMHTGHSVYGTIHANNAEETIQRLTNPPINVPKQVISSLGLVLVQNRNRRTGKRRSLQLAEILETGEPNVLMQLDAQKDKIFPANEAVRLYKTLSLYTGMTKDGVIKDLKKKEEILRAIVKADIEDVHEIGYIMAKYYMGELKISDITKQKK